MNKEKHVIPFAAVLLLSLIVGRSLFMKSRHELILESSTELIFDKYDKENEEGTGFIRVRLFTKPDPAEEKSIHQMERDRLLAQYQQ